MTESTHPPLLNNLNYCHNLSVKRLMKWYDEVNKNKDLIVSVMALGIDLKWFDKSLSDIVNRVLTNLNESAKNERIDELLRFDPYYAKITND